MADFSPLYSRGVLSMRGSPDKAGMPDVRSRRAFFRFEIVPDDRPLKVKLESTPDLSHSEMRGARGPFFRSRFGHIFSLAFLDSSLWPRFVTPIVTVEMECALRTRGSHAKSSCQKHPILMQCFNASARIPRPRVNGA